MQHRLILRIGGALVAMVLLVAACGEDDATTTEAPTSRAPTTDEGSGDTTTTATSAPASEDIDVAAEGVVIEVTVSGGQVEGGGRHEVAVGDTVTLLVTSDVADHVHVHGYDVFADVGPGETVEVTFTADIPGVFEVELEDSHLPLLELQVS